MLDIRNLSAGYPGNPVLTDISLSIPEGAVTVIIGPNGSGKCRNNRKRYNRQRQLRMVFCSFKSRYVPYHNR